MKNNNITYLWTINVALVSALFIFLGTRCLGFYSLRGSWALLPLAFSCWFMMMGVLFSEWKKPGDSFTRFIGLFIFLLIEIGVLASTLQKGRSRLNGTFLIELYVLGPMVCFFLGYYWNAIRPRASFRPIRIPLYALALILYLACQYLLDGWTARHVSQVELGPSTAIKRLSLTGISPQMIYRALLWFGCLIGMIISTLGVIDFCRNPFAIRQMSKRWIRIPFIVTGSVVWMYYMVRFHTYSPVDVVIKWINPLSLGAIILIWNGSIKIAKLIRRRSVIKRTRFLRDNKRSLLVKPDGDINVKDTSDFLGLFEKENGFKYLTHDFLSSGLDYQKYLEKCMDQIIYRGTNKQIAPDAYDLVQGYVFGPVWTDFKGKEHSMFLSSEECKAYYKETKNHPLNNSEFQPDIDAFRHSIRFRNGKLYQFFDEMKEIFPNLNITIERNVKAADFYTDTRHFRNAVAEIISSMNEYREHPDVVIGYEEDDSSDPDYVICSVSIEQKDSFSSHTIEQDWMRLQSGGGTLNSIKKSLLGNANWYIVSKWSDGDEPMRWNILSDTERPQFEKAEMANGFRHVISVYQKK